MRLYLADSNNFNFAAAHRTVSQATGRHLRVLMSFWYYRRQPLDQLFARDYPGLYPEVFADSGAFSALMQGGTISLDRYAAWVKHWSHLFTVYANLDVIGNPDATWENQQRLEDMGLSPLPVYHVGEPFSYLERYLERYPYIALGGMVPYVRRPRLIMPWLVQCFKLAQGRAVFHGFGCTTWLILKSLPWYSVDSSSWGQGFRFGEIPLFDENKGQFQDIQLGHKQSCYRHAALIRALGFDPADFANRARNDRAMICGISALSYLKAESWLQRRHGDVVLPKGNRV